MITHYKYGGLVYDNETKGYIIPNINVGRIVPNLAQVVFVDEQEQKMAEGMGESIIIETHIEHEEKDVPLWLESDLVPPITSADYKVPPMSPIGFYDKEIIAEVLSHHPWLDR